MSSDNETYQLESESHSGSDLSDYAFHVPEVYYPINDDIFGLTEKQKKLRQSVFDFMQEELKRNASESDRKSLFDDRRQLWKEFGKLGLLGIAIEKEYGGEGGCYLDQVIIQEELARVSATSSMYYNEQSMFCVYPINCLGTEEQKRKYLPKLCSGEHIGSILISNNEESPSRQPKEVKAKKQGDYYILDGSDGSSYGFDFDILLLYVITKCSLSEFGMTAFIIERSFKGLIVSEHSTNDSNVRYKYKFVDCKVPASNILGKKNNGLEYLIKSKDMKNLILMGGPIGLMQAFCDDTFEKIYVENYFTELKGKLCGMHTKLCSSRNYLYTVVRACDNGYMNRKDRFAVALYCTKNLAKLSLDIKEILGENIDDATKRLLDQVKLYTTAAGSNKSKRKNISELISDEYSK